MSEPTRIRVLVVDDAVVIRRLVSQVIEADPALELAGVAANGKIALSRIAIDPPDVVTLDIEMPELDGLATLAELRKTHPRLPVIMFSTLTERGASETLRALELGATDYVTKPANVGSVNAAIERVQAELVPKIKSLCGQPVAAPPPVGRPLAIATPTTTRIDAVAIASSTGGPNALTEVIPALPADLPVPVFITQHMPPVFTRIFADRLDAVSGVQVREAAPGDEAEPGTVWVAAGDHHLVLKRKLNRVVLDFDDGPPESSCRPAADVMLRSIAATYGARVLAVVLTGMGYDGLKGCEQLRDLGAQIVAQDQASSVVWGMPGAVATAGLADAVLPIDLIGAEITRRVQAGALLGSR